MASNATATGAAPDGYSEKKKGDLQNNLETGSTDIEPAPMRYTPDDDQKDESVEINYHTLTWWYVHRHSTHHQHSNLPTDSLAPGKPEW